ncbi:hypothetical protein WJX79_001839 [Trebouxia sp. C0005]
MSITNSGRLLSRRRPPTIAKCCTLTSTRKVGTFWDASRPLIKAPHEPHHSGLHHFIHHEGKAQISYPIHKFTVVARQLSILAEN